MYKTRISSPRVTGTLAMLTAAVLWAFIAPFTKICLHEGMTPLSIAFWRALIGAACFLLHVRLRHGTLAIAPRDAGVLALFGVVGVGVFYAALQIAIARSGAATAMILMYTAPVWVALMAWAFFQERVTPLTWLCVGMGLAGAALVALSGGSLATGTTVSTWGIVCGLVSGLCYALYFPFSVWWGGRHGAAVLYAWASAGGALSLLPWADFAAMPVWSGSVTAWGALLGLGVITNYIAYAAYGYSLQRIPQVQAAVMGNVEPMLATLLVWYLWDENFAPVGWLGSALILCAVVLLALRR